MKTGLYIIAAVDAFTGFIYYCRGNAAESTNYYMTSLLTLYIADHYV